MLSSHGIINLMHVAFIAPLLIYVGFARDTIPEWLFYVLGALGVFVLLYQLYKAYGKIKEGKSAWIQWIHVFLVAPLLILLGVLRKDTERRYFEMLLLLGLGALGYHGIYLIREIILA
jgi:membrane-bound metal-dependent hydrolase YbcI (DUF457 family)